MSAVAVAYQVAGEPVPFMRYLAVRSAEVAHKDLDAIRKTRIAPHYYRLTPEVARRHGLTTEGKPLRSSGELQSSAT